MSQWLLVIVLALCGAAFLVIPFLKSRTPAEAGNNPGEALKPVSSEQPAGSDAAKREGAVPPAAPSRRGSYVTAGAIAAVVVAGAAGLFVATEPSETAVPAPSFALASAPDAAQPKLPDVDTMISRVKERLKTAPNNAEDWRMVAWSYFETQHYPEAVDAYARAVALQPESAAYQSAYGEAQVLAAGGKITPDAMKAFGVALKGAPADERALHFTGLVKKQNGDPKGAVADWIVALKNAKPDSLWAPRLRAEITDTAKLASIDVSSQLPPATPLSEEKFAAPATQLAQQAQSMTPEEQQSMIKTMVAGLDERLTRNPRDRDGWVRLIRSRKVLGEPELARTALDKALTAFQDDPTTQVALKTAAMELGVSTGP